MMDRRPWPWRKKLSEKSSAFDQSDTSSPSHSSKLSDEQELFTATEKYTRESQDVIKSQSAEVQVRNLNEKLMAALSEISAKDMAVKQHVRVAEEAVSGWEKAEAEAVTWKHKLELSQQEKLALEDRVSHLDGALKECMHQLRLAREEQEQAIHAALVKKTRESEKLCSEMETKLSEMGQKFVEFAAEKRVLEKALQERNITNSELHDAKCRAETEAEVLKVRLDVLEKENSALKYELHLSSKEVEICSKEREYTRKAAEASHNQHLENVKKIATLETECQRLRVLVKKKLPGPAAFTQMRLEAEALGKESVGKKKKIVGKVGGPLRNMISDALGEGSQTGSNDSEVLSEKLVAMEEETKMLKEALRSKTNELQEARLVHAKTASKLSKIEQQLDILSNPIVVPAGHANLGVACIDSIVEIKKILSFASISGGSSTATDLNCADVWAAALLAELENFRKDKANESPDKLCDSVNLDIMDDFIEMERLASTISPPQTAYDTFDHVPAEQAMSGDDVGHDLSVLKQLLATRDRELQAAQQLALELRNKLSTAEEQLSVLQSKDSANEKILFHLPKKINSLMKNQTEDVDGGNMFKETTLMMKELSEMQSSAEPVANEFSLCSGGSSRSSQLHLQPPCASSEETSSEADASTTLSEYDTRPKLCVAAVCKLVHLVELVAQHLGFEYTHLLQEEQEKFTAGFIVSEWNLSAQQVVPRMNWSHPTVNSIICYLVQLANRFVQGKVHSPEFVAELCSVVTCILNLGMPKPAETMKNFGNSIELLPLSAEVLDSSLSQVAVLIGIDSEEKIDSGETTNTLPPVASQAGMPESIAFSSLDSEKKLSDSDTSMHDFHRIPSSDEGLVLSEDLAKLKMGRTEMEQLERSKGRTETLKKQVLNAEQLFSDLGLEHAPSVELKWSADDMIEAVACSKSSLEYQFTVAAVGANNFQEMAVTVIELDKETEHHQELNGRLECLPQLLLDGIPPDQNLAQLSVEESENPAHSEDETQLQKVIGKIVSEEISGLEVSKKCIDNGGIITS